MNSNNDTKNLKKSRLKTSRGFTLIELLVTLSMFVVLTTVVLFRSSQFNGSILLTNLAYDVAITIRQAQSFGVNVREASTNVFDKAYGVHFDISKDKRFLLFFDSSGGGNEGRYAGSWTCNGGSDECLNIYSLKRGNKISDIKVTSPSCSPLSSCSVSELNITFLRPNPDARFVAKKSGGSYFGDITSATITISSADDLSSRYIVVNSTGQISVKKIE